MNKAKHMVCNSKIGEDFIAAIAICAVMLGEGQLFSPVENGVNL